MLFRKIINNWCYRWLRVRKIQYWILELAIGKLKYLIEKLNWNWKRKCGKFK